MPSRSGVPGGAAGDTSGADLLRWQPRGRDLAEAILPGADVLDRGELLLVRDGRIPRGCAGGPTRPCRSKVMSCLWLRAKSAKSRLLALPFNSAQPATSSATVIWPSPLRSTRSNTMSISFTSKPIADSHVLISRSFTCCRNSSLVMAPVARSSISAKNACIFCMWIFLFLFPRFIMIVSFFSATLNVTCKKTPIMTRTTAKPMKN
mmetsp:Transcript_49974/g.145317  ORF Transcript_49974/g.145317 Transcript_49974/m.145317 type:complete len:206 (-) Transcript_49974:187-804(-)